MSGPSRAASFSSALRVVAQLALLWWLFATAEVALALCFDGSTLRSDLLPAVLRRDLMARELALLAIVVSACAAVLGLCARLLRVGGTLLSRAFVAIGAAIPIAFFLISWTTFRSTGRFLGPSSIEFLAMNPVQFFQHAVHIEPMLFVFVPVGLIILLTVSLGGTAAVAARLGDTAKWIVLGVTAFAFVASVLLGRRDAGALTDFALDEAVIDPDAGYMYSYGELYTLCREDRSGPLSHVWTELRLANDASREPPFADPLVPVSRRPIISIEEWRAKAVPAEIRRWNVLHVIVESLRPDQLRIFGGPREVMPTLERIAREGRAYSDHYTQASHSNYADLCSLSSHYPLRSTGVHLYPKNPTYPRVLIYDLLKSLGWHTAVISSQNEVWGQMINYLRTGNIDHFFHSETYTGPTYVPRDDDGFAGFLKGSRRSGKIDDRFTVAEAIRWIESLGDDNPFFIYLNLQNSHLPYETPADFPRPFGPDSIDFTIRFGGYPFEKTAIVKDLYADSLAYSDHQLGKLVEYLKDTGQWDRTLVIVTGDTGQAFYEHGKMAHAGPIWNEVMRVPLVIRAPGLDPALDRRPAQHIDIPPTVLDLLGLPPHPSFQGVSLHQPYDGADRSRFLMAQTPLALQFGIVRGNFKLIYDTKTDRTNLFNLVRDPGETQNVAAQNRKRLKRYRMLLDTWRKQQLDYYRDPALHARTYPPVLQD